jgi:cytochrome oxidase assembly protein ShyY1
MRREAQAEWFAIARTPAWLGRLAIALALAAVFALLGQWQLSRAVPAANPTPSPISTPGATSGGELVGLRVFTVQPDLNNLEIISRRFQPLGDAGFWLISNSKVLVSQKPTDVGRELTVAWGWAPTFERAVAAHVKFQSGRFGRGGVEISGVLSDSEAPTQGHPEKPFLFDSLSVAQLINVYKPVQARDSFDQFLVFQPLAESEFAPGLDPIALKNAPKQPLDNVNWLSAFYAIEWTVFAGFAVFMWWRLVEDERLRRRAEAEAAAAAELERVRLEAEAEAEAAAKAKAAKAKAARAKAAKAKAAKAEPKPMLEPVPEPKAPAKPRKPRAPKKLD